MDNFQVVLSSNVDSKEDIKNQPTHFVNPLVTPLKLNGSWECGLSEVFLSPATLKFTFQLAEVIVHKNNYLDIRRIVSYEAKDPTNTEEVVVTINKTRDYLISKRKTFTDGKYSMLPFDLFLLFSKSNFFHKVPFNIPSSERELEDAIHSLYDDFSGQKLIKSKVEGSLFQFKENFLTSFCIAKCINAKNRNRYLIVIPHPNDRQTQKILNLLSAEAPLHGVSYNGLFFYKIKIHKDKFNSYLSPIDININIVAYTKNGNKNQQILRNILRYNPYSIEHQIFRKIVYKPIIKSNVDSIEVTLTNPSGKDVCLYHECQLTLLFRKV